MEAFRLVRQKVPCQLVLVGSPAADDPQGEEIFREVFRKSEGEKDVTLICLQSDLLVNAVQRKASVVIQKSLREGFGLTVSEALWKGTPVVASRVGGIPLQIENGRNGFLVNGVRECAERTAYLLRNEKKARQMGELGREKVRANFLVTRLVKDEIAMFRKVTSASESVATKIPREMLRRTLALPEFALSLPLSALDTFGRVGSRVRSTVRSTTGI
jgi:trehalose synthase